MLVCSGGSGDGGGGGGGCNGSGDDESMKYIATVQRYKQVPLVYCALFHPYRTISRTMASAITVPKLAFATPSTIYNC